jgi:DNA-binding CsgD family transcriptional regulator
MLPYTFRASGQRQTAGFQVDKQKIAALYDFTNAEAERCVNLFESGHLGDVLDKLGISNNTAKPHLRHIIEKVGVSSQTQLLHGIEPCECQYNSTRASG